MRDNYYIGTDLKFAITLTADGFSMDDDNYSIVVVCGDKRVEYNKSDIVTDGSGGHFLCIDTSQFSPGVVRMIVYADVPDAAFGDGTRREVASMDLCQIKKT
jgi:hypothetical protein